MRGLAKAYYDIVKLRVALGNILRHEHSWHPYINQLYQEAKEREEKLIQLCREGLTNEPVYNTFLAKVRGVGPVMAAYLLDYFDIHKATHVSSFWKFAGLAPGSKRAKGKKVAYNPALKSIILGRIFKQLQMARGFYHQLYKQIKAEEMRLHPEWRQNRKTIGKYHARARLKTMKIFTQHLWLIWREVEGLPTTKPYATERMGHTYIPPPLEQNKI